MVPALARRRRAADVSGAPFRHAETEDAPLNEPNDGLDSLLPPRTVGAPRRHHRHRLLGSGADRPVVLCTYQVHVPQQLTSVRGAKNEKSYHRERVLACIGEGTTAANGRVVLLSVRHAWVEHDESEYGCPAAITA
jgi:hypothetical protein